MKWCYGLIIGRMPSTAPRECASLLIGARPPVRAIYEALVAIVMRVQQGRCFCILKTRKDYRNLFAEPAQLLSVSVRAPALIKAHHFQHATRGR